MCVARGDEDRVDARVIDGVAGFGAPPGGVPSGQGTRRVGDRVAHPGQFGLATLDDGTRMDLADPAGPEQCDAEHGAVPPW
jgi:hypothetical protein